MKGFIITLSFALLVFGGANLASLVVRSDDENGGEPPDWLPRERFGFPFLTAEWRGVNPNDERLIYFSKSGMWGNIPIALFASSLLAAASMKALLNPREQVYEN